MHEPLGVHLDVPRQAILLRPRGQQHLEELAVGMAMMTWRLATLLSELPPWWISKFMWKPSARWAVFTNGVMPPFTATSPRR